MLATTDADDGVETGFPARRDTGNRVLEDRRPRRLDFQPLQCLAKQRRVRFAWQIKSC